MKKSAYDAAAAVFLSNNTDTIVGNLNNNTNFSVTLLQNNSWNFTIDHLRSVITHLPRSHIFLEFVIPRMGRRVDAIIINEGTIFILEYKVGTSTISKQAIDQALGYALDLKNFHEPSHKLDIIPIIIIPESHEIVFEIQRNEDGIYNPILTNGSNLVQIIKSINSEPKNNLNPKQWLEGRYRPTPTIIEAAQSLYKNHNVMDITRNEAGAENLTLTSSYIEGIITDSKLQSKKSICFVSGVPGSGKTLAGLNIATLKSQGPDDEHVVFLSGNGPLVKVLRKALILDSKADPLRSSRSVDQFIQNIHHFRDDNLRSNVAPFERVVIFDEAQRAWNRKKTSQFMRQDRSIPDFNMSEPEFLLSVMNRHNEWCVVVCLIGNGQEINTGEAGINAWIEALVEHFPDWNVHLSKKIVESYSSFGIKRLPEKTHSSAELHLTTSIRSFRSDKVSAYVSALIESDIDSAQKISKHIQSFEFRITRDLNHARNCIRNRRRGAERSGLLAFSNAIRLKPEGVFVKNSIEPEDWFLKDRFDIRSSDYLEDVATEFDVQGLELDWACVCIDANLRLDSHRKLYPQLFKGSKWQNVNDPERHQYILNAHRVLLTRARQGNILFVPFGDHNDETRNPIWYDNLYDYFLEYGLKPI